MMNQLNLISTKDSFSILTWNTLANQLCDSQSFPKVSDFSLNFDRRIKKIIEIIQSYNPDIISLEEVDYADHLDTLLQNEHHTYFKPKEEGRDGIYVAVKKSKFLIKSQSSHNYLDQNGKQMTQLFVLSHLQFQQNPEKQIILASTHLKAKEQFESIREQQIKNFLQTISHQIKNFYDNQNEKSQTFDQFPLIFTGDFNTEPLCPSILNLTQSLFQKYDIPFKCAFEANDITTFKIREKTYLRKIDYMFYNTKAFLPTIQNNLPIKQKNEQQIQQENKKLY
ncbi:Endonuclease/exonuclease/phosphatase [Pseudocohnilembus persalinus]|uniref:Endonuclease/exonuclease/phosphatase n=1 Tax=Pseudocohnilembus persalinus TaxID=266149 RepID=A0A0V0QDF8_PSEPJ|nr:Endonuclease/exonuclease/phosphatase [Pseudocohnilembus persalinus]|eukprot:KRX00234.1 Endonuclease/exonuclease/phosphatase [Pseudocohnilembus persalinus]